MNITDRLDAEINYSTSDKNGYREGEKKDLDFIQVGANYKLDDGKLGFKYSHNKKVANDRITGLNKKEYDEDRKQNKNAGRLGTDEQDKYILTFDGKLGFKYSHNKKVANDRITGLNKKEYDEDRKQNKNAGRLGTDEQDKYILTFDKKLTDNLEFSSVVEYRERDYKYNYNGKNDNPKYRKRTKDTESFYTNAQLKYNYLKYNYLDNSYLILGGDYSKAKVKEDTWATPKKGEKKVYYQSHSDIDFEAIGGYILNKYSYNNFIFTQGIRIEKNEFDEDKTTFNSSGEINSKKTGRTKDSPTNKYSYNNFIFTQGIRIEKNEFDEDKTTFNSSGEINSKKTGRTKDSPTNTNYELTANYLFDEDTSAFFSYNRVKRNPSLTEFSSWWEEKSPKKEAQTVDTFELGTKTLIENIYLASYNRVKRNPSLTEFSSWWEEKSPKKEAQTVDTFELGTKTLIENIYLAGSIFYINGDKEIMYDPVNGTMVGSSFYNLNGKTERIGLELASEQYFDKLTLRENFTYMHNEITDGPYKGNEIPGVSKLMYGLGATYEITPQLIFNLETLYHGKAYAANDFYNKKSKVDSYMVTNISTRYNFNNGLSIFGGINNLFNEQYCDYVNYDSKNDVIKYAASPERNYYIGMEYKF